MAVVLGEQVLFEEQAAGLALAFLKVLDPGLEAAQHALLGQGSVTAVSHVSFIFCEDLAPVKGTQIWVANGLEHSSLKTLVLELGSELLSPLSSESVLELVNLLLKLDVLLRKVVNNTPAVLVGHPRYTRLHFHGHLDVIPFFGYDFDGPLLPPPGLDEAVAVETLSRSPGVEDELAALFVTGVARTELLDAGHVLEDPFPGLGAEVWEAR